MQKKSAFIAILFGFMCVSACRQHQATVTTFPLSSEKTTDNDAVRDENARRFNALVQAGHYDYVNPAIINGTCSDLQSFRAESVSSFALIHFDEWLGSDEVLQKIRKMGYEPASAEDLLVFGSRFPDEQRKYPIVAPGSSCMIDGRSDVAYLWSSGSERFLSLSWVASDWSERYRFLAVRK